MKKFLSFLTGLVLSTMVSAQRDAPSKTALPDPNQKVDTLDVSCGMCQFDMTGKDCALAVRINGRPYYVTGTKIDDHGDAHAADGFCNKVRKAAVQGTLDSGKYKVTYFSLLPLAAAKP